MDKKMVEEIRARIKAYRQGKEMPLDSMMEMLYGQFIEFCRTDTPEIREQLQTVEFMLSELGKGKQADRCMNEVNFLCSEYERVGFLAGMTVGAKMMIELLGE